MSSPYPLHKLFPGGDFEWAFRMRKVDPADFFASTHGGDAVLEQKRRILSEHPQRHLGQDAVALGLLEGLHHAMGNWGVVLPSDADNLQAIASQIEPDLLLMDQQSLRLRAAAVCFPSSWDPGHWIGHPILEIHEVVPGLNASIGEMITRFLSQLAPGKAFQRANWSFTRSAELNYHPALQRPPLDQDIGLEEIFLRIEHQLFTAIKGAVVMGIRIQPIALSSLQEDQALWQKLIQILKTMPEDVARYKNLHRGRQSLIDAMRKL